MDTLLSLALGVGLAAACGFRVFVPLLVAGAAARLDYISLHGGFAWLESDPALLAFGAATLLEIAAYYVPWLDNLLDGAAGPLAVTAGVLVAAAVVEGDPLLRWTLAVVAGGGAAAGVQFLTTAARALSSAATAGFGNWIVSTVEALGALLLSVLAVAVPLLAAAAALLVLGIAWSRVRARRASGPPASA
jgi:hypothetical protein